jgi:hypothetical protein
MTVLKSIRAPSTYELYKKINALHEIIDDYEDVMDQQNALGISSAATLSHLISVIVYTRNQSSLMDFDGLMIRPTEVRDNLHGL